MQKLLPELEVLEMKHIPRIINTAYHDMVVEEAWEFLNKAPKIDCNALKRVCHKKAKQIFIDVLNDDISVADKQDD